MWTGIWKPRGKCDGSNLETCDKVWQLFCDQPLWKCNYRVNVLLQSEQVSRALWTSQPMSYFCCLNDQALTPPLLYAVVIEDGFIAASFYCYLILCTSDFLGRLTASALSYWIKSSCTARNAPLDAGHLIFGHRVSLSLKLRANIVSLWEWASQLNCCVKTGSTSSSGLSVSHTNTHTSNNHFFI